MRRENNLPEGEKIHISKIPELVEYYNKKLDENKKYIVLNQNQEIVLCNFNKVNNEYDDEIYDTDNVVQLYIKDEHFYNFESITIILALNFKLLRAKV